MSYVGEVSSDPQLFIIRLSVLFSLGVFARPRPVKVSSAGRIEGFQSRAPWVAEVANTAESTGSCSSSQRASRGGWSR
ncbi:hypothetical protein F5Y15DRAFT_365376 [Xylariaceae sp. FL0016]|nr:hypothetical protein F5Y15DRAFT_365376 [Xylariaceae sp. FL0016]